MLCKCKLLMDQKITLNDLNSIYEIKSVSNSDRTNGIFHFKKKSIKN